MIKKFEIMFGILFVLLMVGAVQGAGFDWATYGGNLNYITQSQFPNAHADFTTSNVLIQNMSNGINVDSGANSFTSYQPIIADLNGTQEYIIIPNNNYIQIYNQNFVLFQEFLTGSVMSQLDVTDFDGDGLTNDVVGVFKINNSDYYFGVYSFNATTFSFVNTYQKNYTDNVSQVKIAGVRCLQKNCYFINAGNLIGTLYNQTFQQINSSFSSSFELPDTNLSSNEYYDEPLSFNDVDRDGKDEFLTFSDHKVILFRQDSSILWTYDTATPLYRHITGAKIFHPDSSSVWKIAILEGFGQSGSPSRNYLTVLRPDGSTLWSKTFTYGTSENYVNGALAITNDYDGDGFNDIYSIGFDDHFTAIYNNNIAINILRGTDGTVLTSRNFNNLGWNYNSGNLRFDFTIANLNSGSKDDLIMSVANHIIAFDIYNNQTLFYKNSTLASYYGCVPADLFLRGSLDVVCSGTSGTEVYYTNFTNQNPTISSITYNPDIIIPINNYIYAFISATDPDGDVMVYARSCFDGDILSSFTTSSTQSCYYSAVGTYNMTIAVRDTYHTDYSQFSQMITVTETGAFCNNNGTCDLGENNVNCPSDCPVTIPTQSSETGGSTLPSEIVSTTDYNQGLLPEVYFGTLGFLSNTIQPMMILIFVIFFVLIILTIAIIVRKIGKQVGDMGGK